MEAFPLLQRVLQSFSTTTTPVGPIRNRRREGDRQIPNKATWQLVETEPVGLVTVNPASLGGTGWGALSREWSALVCFRKAALQALQRHFCCVFFKEQFFSLQQASLGIELVKKLAGHWWFEKTHSMPQWSEGSSDVPSWVSYLGPVGSDHLTSQYFWGLCPETHIHGPPLAVL